MVGGTDFRNAGVVGMTRLRTESSVLKAVGFVDCLGT